MSVQIPPNGRTTAYVLKSPEGEYLGPSYWVKALEEAHGYETYDEADRKIRDRHQACSVVKVEITVHVRTLFKGE